ncbi:uncharacterized protein [Ambystoma mexicanum]|uniref:uncharacterized protein isoform X2 n=1 Tax=Ambystoma mexicanum TaxID=8296 RepID=UPI0037E8AEF7
MAGVSLYQGLQFQDQNIYSVLNNKATGSHQLCLEEEHLKKEIKLLKWKLRLWRIMAIVVLILAVLSVALGAIFFPNLCNAGKTVDINDASLPELRSRICAREEMIIQ